MENKRIVVLGGGESGVGAAVLAKVKGFDVFLSDKYPISENYKAILEKYNIVWEEGKHTLDKMLIADEVIKSPGITETLTVMLDIIKKGSRSTSEIEFAGRFTHSNMI